MVRTTEIQEAASKYIITTVILTVIVVILLGMRRDIVKSHNNITG